MKIEKLFYFLLTVFFTGTLTAGNVENLLIECERKTHVYKKGETAKFFVTVKDKEGKNLAGKNVKCVITHETGRKTISFLSMQTPVFVAVTQKTAGSCSVTGCIVDEKGQKVRNSKSRVIQAGCGAAFSLEEIFQGYPEEKDFDGFWQKQKELLAKVPVKAEYKKIDLATWQNGRWKRYAEKILVYDVKISCVGSMPVTGYLAMPAKAEKKSLPIVMLYHPYGVRSANIPFGYGEKAIAFDVNANGLENGREASYYRKIQNGPLKNYFFFGNTDREKIYFKNMYLRALRALEVMKSRPEWNGKDVIVSGYSQGGAQALAVAGLDKEVTLCVASCPALCDLGGVWAGRRSGWIVPQNKLKKGKDGKCVSKEGDKIIKATSYIDNANFAKRIKAETHISSGDFDTVCPMASVYAAYRNIPGKRKSFTILKNMGHWAVNPEGTKAINRILNRKK